MSQISHSAGNLGQVFAQRPASQAWEVVGLPTNPPMQIWAWFKPAQAPNSVMLQVPPAAGYQVAFTLRIALAALGIDPVSVAAGSVFGYQFTGDNGVSPFFDHVLTGPAPGTDPNIVVYLNVSAVPPAPAVVADPDAELDDVALEIFRSFERDWKTTNSLERQMTGLRKQLVDMQQRLNTMNRDLTPDEQLFSDRSDHDDWREARRWLREAATRLSKYVKELVAGETTYAGKKAWFEQIYNEFVSTKTPFAGMEEARSEFEYYRRTIQNLSDRMQSAYHHAQQEGVQRAQNILSRIASKVSANKAKMR